MKCEYIISLTKGLWHGNTTTSPTAEPQAFYHYYYYYSGSHCHHYLDIRLSHYHSPYFSHYHIQPHRCSWSCTYHHALRLPSTNGSRPIGFASPTYAA